MKRKPINEYLVGPATKEWVRMNENFLFANPGEEKYTAGFMRADGIQLCVSAREFDGEEVLHVTLSPVYELRPDIRPEDLQEHLASKTFTILQEFFGVERSFTRQPNDPRPVAKDARHYFSYL